MKNNQIDILINTNSDGYYIYHHPEYKIYRFNNSEYGLHRKTIEKILNSYANALLYSNSDELILNTFANIKINKLIINQCKSYDEVKPYYNYTGKQSHAYNQKQIYLKQSMYKELNNFL